jgi:1-acyl-sn-glycerol-3-phosphate acyltransferase
VADIGAVVGEPAARFAGVNDRPHAFYIAMGAAVYPLARGVWRMKVLGSEHLPREGGFVIACNHLSLFDPYVVAYPFFPHRPLRYMAKAELYRGPLRPLLYAAGAFPVRRGEGDVGAFKTAVRLAKSGAIVVVFPFGMREKIARRKKIELSARGGAARIALAAGVPLVPAGIVGSDRLPMPTKLRLAFGATDLLDGLDHMRERDAAGVATERLAERITELRALAAAA